MEKKCNVCYKDNILTVNGVAYPMVLVEGGTFVWYHHIYALPWRQITLNTYRVGKYEVTQDLWHAVMGTDPSHFKAPRKPVEMVSWNDCQIFIEKLNELTGLHFRLPTEAEWEFAARGGVHETGRIYSGSDSFDDVAWTSENGAMMTHEVGVKSPNELGLYDMSGNVWEWCSDWWQFKLPQGECVDPIGPEVGVDRVCRGGSWLVNERYSRNTTRYSGSPDSRVSTIGFRLCL